MKILISIMLTILLVSIVSAIEVPYPRDMPWEDYKDLVEETHNPKKWYSFIQQGIFGIDDHWDACEGNCWNFPPEYDCDACGSGYDQTNCAWHPDQISTANPYSSGQAFCASFDASVYQGEWNKQCYCVGTEAPPSGDGECRMEGSTEWCCNDAGDIFCDWPDKQCGSPGYCSNYNNPQVSCLPSDPDWCCNDAGYVLDYSADYCCQPDYPFYHYDPTGSCWNGRVPSANNYYTNQAECDYIWNPSTSTYEIEDGCSGSDYLVCQQNKISQWIDGWDNRGQTPDECGITGTTTITIRSDPTGANIFMDGVDTGEITSYTWTGPSGYHEITMKKPGFADCMTSGFFAAGEHLTPAICPLENLGGTTCITKDDCPPEMIYVPWCEDNTVYTGKISYLCSNGNCNDAILEFPVEDCGTLTCIENVSTQLEIGNSGTWEVGPDETITAMGQYMCGYFGKDYPNDKFNSVEIWLDNIDFTGDVTVKLLNYVTERSEEIIYRQAVIPSSEITGPGYYEAKFAYDGIPTTDPEPGRCFDFVVEPIGTGRMKVGYNVGTYNDNNGYIVYRGDDDFWYQYGSRDLTIKFLQRKLLETKCEDLSVYADLILEINASNTDTIPLIFDIETATPQQFLDSLSSITPQTVQPGEEAIIESDIIDMSQTTLPQDFRVQMEATGEGRAPSSKTATLTIE